jgi:hypothetical protein
MIRNDIRVRVSSIDASMAEVLEEGADLAIGTLGYESRSMHVPLIVGDKAKRVVLIGFESNNVLAFKNNHNLAILREFEVKKVQEQAFAGLIRELAVEAIPSSKAGTTLRIVVDASSMTRVRLARTLIALRDTLPPQSVIDVLYAPAEFIDGAGDNGPVTETGPLPHFAGWGATPDVELGMIIGLGFESHLALGVVESHEPAAVWCYQPNGVDLRYDTKVASENRLLLEAVATNRQLQYNVMRPFAIAESIQGVLNATMESHRMMVVPLGPKVFCLAAIAVALAYDGRLNVWRVSSGTSREPADRIASGPVCGLRLILEPFEQKRVG